jgi:hypothetical protein
LAGLAAAQLAVRSEAPFRIEVVRDQRSVHVRLDTMYKRYRHGEVETAALVEEIKAALGHPNAAVETLGPFPRLVRADRLDPMAIAVPCPFDAELAVQFVRELPHGFLGLGPDEASAWASADALLREASANLLERTQRLEIEGRGGGAQLTMGYATGDGYDAARTLLTDHLRAMSEWLEGSPLVAIPSANMLMLLGDADIDFVAEARSYVADTYERDAEPLSPHLYELATEGLRRTGA